MQCASDCNEPFGTGSYDTLNANTWEPGSQTQWSGQQTGGYPVVTATHNWDFADHYTAFDGTYTPSTQILSMGTEDAFQNVQFNQMSSSTQGGQQIDLCDPLVTS